MDILKTIFRLSFFILGFIMLAFAILVMKLGFTDFIWFFGFSVFFFILGGYYTSKFGLIVYKKSRKIVKPKDKWINLKTQKISYNPAKKQIKLNNKTYEFNQIESIEIMDNSKNVSLREFNGSKTHKKPEIKLGARVNKLTYRHFKYDDSKKGVKKLANDYRTLKSVLKIKKKQEVKIKTKKK